MNRSAEHRLGWLVAIVCQLAGAVPGAPGAWFMGTVSRSKWNKGLSMNQRSAGVPSAGSRSVSPRGSGLAREDSRGETPSEPAGGDARATSSPGDARTVSRYAAFCPSQLP
jgi:hypothetical protein